MKKMTPPVSPDAYVAALGGWRRACVEVLRATVHTALALEEVVKWGHLVYLANGPVLLTRAGGRGRAVSRASEPPRTSGRTGLRACGGASARRKLQAAAEGTGAGSPAPVASGWRVARPAGRGSGGRIRPGARRQDERNIGVARIQVPIPSRADGVEVIPGQ